MAKKAKEARRGVVRRCEGSERSHYGGCILIYFIHNEQSAALKIGFSRDVPNRLRNLSTSSPSPLVLLGTILGGRAREQRLHRQFRDYRLNGEWFAADPFVLNAVHALVNRRCSVWDESRERGRPLSDLAGSYLRHIPTGTIFICRGSESFFDGIPRIYASESFWGSGPCPDAAALVALCLSGRRPEGYRPPETFRASECVLLSPWPVVCCEPN